MAYSIGGKMYTDHALMDEVTYATKIILNGIILKNEKKANNSETSESMIESDILLAIENGSARLSFLPLNEEILVNFGYTLAQAKLIQGEFDEDSQTYHNNLDYVPEEDKESLFKYASKWFVDHYEEKNNYYRLLNGQPEYSKDNNYFIYIKAGSYPQFEDLSTLVDLSKPVHKFTNTEINTIDSMGILDDLKKKYHTENYRYLNYLGAKKIDIIKARKAAIWDILYMPSVENLVSSRFQELYNINRDLYYRYTYQLAYTYNSDYYDELLMFIILCQTFADIITDLPEWYIRRDVFDLRTCQYFLDSQGVKFFKEIPLKFQIRIVKNLNKLIRFKSTTKNIHDILEIFGMEGTTVYKYYIYKKLVRDGKEYKEDDISGDEEWHMPEGDGAYEYGDEGFYNGPSFQPTAVDDIDCLDHAVKDDYDRNPDGTITVHFYDFNDESASDYGDASEEDNKEEQKESKKTYKDEYGNMYELELIKVPIDESYDKYIRNNLYKDDYDSITSQDQYWDGEDVHSYIKNLHLEKDFTVEGTKYMFLDNRVSMKEYTYQMSYFLNMIFSSKINIDDIEVSVPTINSNASFPLKNLCILLYVLSQAYIDHTLDIKYPAISSRTEDKGEFYKYRVEDGAYPQPIITDYDNIDGGFMNEIVTDKYSVRYKNTLGYIYTENWRDNVNGGYTAYFTEFTDMTLYNWMKDNAWFMFNNSLDQRIIYGFNLNADLDRIAIEIGLRHSSFNFEHGFTLEDFGVEGFITADKIDSIEQLLEIYRTNTIAYDNLYNKLVYENDSRDKEVVMNYLFRELFTIPYDKDFYKLKSGEYAKDYTELLKDKDYTLHNYYSKLMAEKDDETRKDNIRLALNEITDTLEYYIKSDDTKWVFSFVPTNSLEAINKYISLMINFFKSWKVYFLDPHVTYVLDDRRENKIFMNDNLTEIKEKWWYYDKFILQDALLLTEKFIIREDEAAGRQEVVDIYNYTQWWASDDIDFDGLYADSDPGTEPPFDENWDIIWGSDSSNQEIEYVLVSGNAFNTIQNDIVLLYGGDAELNPFFNEEYIWVTTGALDVSANYIYNGLDSKEESDIHADGGDSDVEVIVTILDTMSSTDTPADFVYYGLDAYDDSDDSLDCGDADDSDLPVEHKEKRTYTKIFIPKYKDSLVLYEPNINENYTLIYGGMSTEELHIYAIFNNGNSVELPDEDIYRIEDGGTAIDDSDHGDYIELRNLNGGKVSVVESAPYWLIDGGHISARKNIYDLDGGNAITARDYLEVDGLHILLDKGNYWPLEPGTFDAVSFEINGGWVDQDVTRSNAVVNTIKGHTIKNELLLSHYPKNSLQLYENGLYLGSEDFVYLTDVEELRYQIISDRQSYEEDLNNCLKIVRMMNNPDIMRGVVDDLFEEYFAISTKMLEEYESNTIVTETMRKVGTQVAELTNWFVELDLFGWDYF